MNESRIAQEMAHLLGDASRKNQCGMRHRQYDMICRILDLRLGNSHDPIVRLLKSADQSSQSDRQAPGDHTNDHTIRKIYTGWRFPDSVAFSE